MIRQSSSAGPWKYLHNYYKNICAKLLQKKERKKKKEQITLLQVTKRRTTKHSKK